MRWTICFYNQVLWVPILLCIFVDCNMVKPKVILLIIYYRNTVLWHHAIESRSELNFERSFITWIDLQLLVTDFLIKIYGFIMVYLFSLHAVKTEWYCHDCKAKARGTPSSTFTTKLALRTERLKLVQSVRSTNKLNTADDLYAASLLVRAWGWQLRSSISLEKAGQNVQVVPVDQLFWHN